MVTACLALTISFGCGGSAPTAPMGASNRAWDAYDPAPDQYIEPKYREPVGPAVLKDELDPNTDPPDAEEPPPDEGPIDEPAPDPYVEDPNYDPSNDVAPVDDVPPDSEPPGDEGPIDEPAPDPYVEGDPPPDDEPPVDEPPADDNPPPDDEPPPDDNPPPDDEPPGDEGPIDEPAPDPYVENDPPPDDEPPAPEDDVPPDSPMAIEYASVIPVMDGRGPARLADANDDGAFRVWGPQLHLGGLRFEYQARFQPGQLRGSAYHAVGRALGTWERASHERLFRLCYLGGGTSGPERDGRSVVCWRNFTGPYAALPAVAYIWDNGHDIVEADIVLNTGRAWGIGAELQPGEQRTLNNMLFDLQSVVTHEVGHVLGLADRDDAASEGSTMHEGLRMRELRAQTLSQGDLNGLAFLMQQARRTRPERGQTRAVAAGQASGNGATQSETGLASQLTSTLDG